MRWQAADWHQHISLPGSAKFQGIISPHLGAEESQTVQRICSSSRVLPPKNPVFRQDFTAELMRSHGPHFQWLHFQIERSLLTTPSDLPPSPSFENHYAAESYVHLNLHFCSQNFRNTLQILETDVISQHLLLFCEHRAYRSDLLITEKGEELSSLFSLEQNFESTELD